MSAGRVRRATMHKPNDSSNTCKKESWQSEGLGAAGPDEGEVALGRRSRMDTANLMSSLASVLHALSTQVAKSNSIGDHRRRFSANCNS